MHLGSLVVQKATTPYLHEVGNPASSEVFEEGDKETSQRSS